MGLFEKQIPKYVRTLDGNVAVQPTRIDASLVPDLRVDDIFDPLFNANVRERLRQDYGNLATFAGYNELLNNIWVENDGTFGKGMGLLSAFGRSMEKADDLILGAATEGVKGLTGQGFENPIENIFVNDEDYTGRRFLAAAANAMSGFADGTTVTEDDFGAAWTLPSLGIELGTDVGILGSGVSRALTPHFSEAAAAGKRVSSGEILKNIGKSGNAATTIGEVGQLLSDYDDLMTRVAIDVTAPGLRPAFKKLLGKIAGMIGPASYYNYEDYSMGDMYPSNKFGPDAPNDPSKNIEGLTTLYKNAKAAMDSIPETADEAVSRMSRTADEIADETIADAEMLKLNDFIEDSLEKQAEDAATVELAEKASEEVRTTPTESPAAPKESRRREKLLREAYAATQRDDSRRELMKLGTRKVDVPITVTLYKKYKNSDKWFILHQGAKVPKGMPTEKVTIGTARKEVPVYGYLSPNSAFQKAYNAPFISIDLSPMSSSERTVFNTLYSNGEVSDALYALEKQKLDDWLLNQNTTPDEDRAILQAFEDRWAWRSKKAPPSVISQLKEQLPSQIPHAAHPKQEFEKKVSKSFKRAQRDIKRFTKREGQAIGNVLKRAEASGHPITSLGTDQRSVGTVAEQYDAIFQKKVSKSFKRAQRGIKRFKRAQRDIKRFTKRDEFTEQQREFLKEVRAELFKGLGLVYTDPTFFSNKSRKLSSAGLYDAELSAFAKDAYGSNAFDPIQWLREHSSERPFDNPDPVGTYNTFFRNVRRSSESTPQYIIEDGSSDYSPRGLVLNPTYLDGVIDVVADDAKLARAIHTGEWSDNLATSNAINTYLNDPKRAESLFYRTTSPKWYVSPSERAVLHNANVREAIFDAHAAIDDSRFVWGKGREELYNADTFDEFWNSDEMTTVLRDVLSSGNKPSHYEGFFDTVNGTAVVPPSETHAYDTLSKVPVDAKIAKFKKLLKQAMFPKLDKYYTPPSLYSSIEELVEYFDSNVNLDRISEAVCKSFPEYAAHLIELDRILDNIGTNFVAPVKGIGTASREHRIVSKFKNVAFEDDFTPGFRYAIKQIVAQLGKENVSFERAKYILAPLRDYVQLGLKHGKLPLDNTHASKVVDRFYSEVLPLAERALNAGVLPKKTFIFHNDAFSEEAAKQLNDLLTSDSDAVHFRDLLKYVGINFNNAFAPKSFAFNGAPLGAPPEQLLEHLLSNKYTRTSAWGFKPARDVHTPVPMFLEYDTHVPAKFRDVHKQEIDLDMLTDAGLAEWNAYLKKHNGGADAALAEFKAAYLTDPDPDGAVRYARAGYKGPAHRPYRADWAIHPYEQDPNPQGGGLGLPYRTTIPPAITKSTDIVESVTEIMPARTVPRRVFTGQYEPLKQLPFLKPTTPSDFLQKSDEFLKYLETNELDVLSHNPYYWATSRREYTEMYENLRALQEAYKISDDKLTELLKATDDLDAFRKLPRSSKQFLYMYTSEYVKGVQNLPYHAIDLDSLTYAEYPRDMVERMISKSTSSKKAELKALYGKAPTPALEAFVKRELIDNLDEHHKKFAKFWKPSKTILDFDIPMNGPMEYVRIGENIPMYPEYLQVWSRYGMNMSDAITASSKSPIFSYSGEEVGRMLAALDYTKLYREDLSGIPARQTMAEIVANRQAQMSFFDEEPIERLGGSSAMYRKLKLHGSSANSRTAKPTSPVVQVIDNLRRKRLLKKADRAKATSKATEQLPEAVVETSQAVDEIVTRTLELPPEELVDQILIPEAASTASERADALINSLCSDVIDALDAGFDDARIKSMLPKQWRLFKQISDAKSVAPRNATGDYATLRYEDADRVVREMYALTWGDHRLEFLTDDYKLYYQLKERQLGDILPGAKFWNELAEAGMLTTCLPKGSRKITQLEYALRRNADVINDILDGDYVEVIVHNTVHADEEVRKAILANAQKVDHETVNVTLRFKQGAYDVVSKIKKHLKELDEATFEDIVFAEPEKLTAENLAYLQQFQALERLEREANTITQDFYKMLGFKFDNTDTYSRHAMNFNDNTMLFLQSNFYGQMPSEELDDIVDNIATVRNTRGAFGTRLSSRRFRGHYWNLEYYAPQLFKYRPEERLTSQLTGGALANNQFQTYVDLFYNGNFAISEYFKTPEDLKKVLYAVGPSGKSGNFNNLELVTFKVNSDGRVVGLHRFDKSTDKGLQQALDTPGTILVPTSVIAHIDKMFKTEARMSNKFWVFTNKYFTTPFKLGVLMNPGFLVGNLSDSSMKTVTALAQKYGTTVTKEAENFADSLTACVNLKNTFYSVFEEFLTATKNADFQLNPSETIPDIAAMSPKHRKSLQAWLSNTLRRPIETTLPDGSIQTVYQAIPCDLDPEIISQASFWMNLQTLQMNTSKTREMAELAGVVKKSKYTPKAEGVARIIEILIDNPATRAVMGASEWTESTVRTAMLYNDFKHRRLTPGPEAVRAAKEDFYAFDTATVDALNTMYGAHFDYENVPDFMDAISNAVPFPIFFLKNFYFWMNLFMENPQFVDNVIDVQEGLWEHRKKKDENNEFAKGAKGRGAVPVGDGDLTGWFKGFYKPSPLQSMFGAFSLLNDPVNDLQYRLHPAISGAASAVHYAAPSDLTTLLNPDENLKYRPYSTNPYERNLSPSDPNYNPLEFAVHRANPLERATNTFLRTPSKVASGDAQLSDFLPSIFQPEF